MSKRATVEPRWLNSMLHKWGITMPTAKGWYNVCPMLSSGIAATAPQYGDWDLSPEDFEQLHAAIDALEHKHRCVIYLAYKPWTGPQQEQELARYGVCLRTQQRWLHDAAKMIEVHMARASDGLAMSR